MPRIVWLLVAACSFDADYSHARLKCTDDKCPSGLTCVAGTCTTGIVDAAAGSDAHDGSAGSDAGMAALTCADPGDATIGTIPGTTAGHTNLLSTSCGGSIYNAPETVYRIQGPTTITIGIASTAGLAAYVIGACTQFPTCETNTVATPSAPLTLTLTSGMHLIVVDGVAANLTGTYTLYLSH